jgi:transposase, IS5 family
MFYQFKRAQRTGEGSLHPRPEGRCIRDPPRSRCNKSERGGRPNISIIIMIKLLILQQLYGLSDPQLELQVANRISFRVFLGTTEVIPDYATVWLFRERLIKNGKLGAIWDEFANQLKAEGY